MSSRIETSSSSSTSPFHSPDKYFPSSNKRKCTETSSPEGSPTAAKVKALGHQVAYRPSFEEPIGVIPFSLSSMPISPDTSHDKDSFFTPKFNFSPKKSDEYSLRPPKLELQPKRLFSSSNLNYDSTEQDSLGNFTLPVRGCHSTGLKANRSVSRLGMLNSSLPSSSSSVNSPTVKPGAKKDEKYAVFFNPKLPEGAVDTKLHGDFHHVYKLSGDDTCIIKTLRRTKPCKKKECQVNYTTSEMVSTIKDTIEAIEKYKNYQSSHVRFAALLNKETYLQDGYYKYEFIAGRKATFADLKEFLKVLVQDPKQHYLADFKPDNVIMPYDGNLPVVIDPTYDESKWDEADYDKFTKLSDSDEWQDRIMNLATLLIKCYNDDDNINQLLNEFDGLGFPIKGTKDIWKGVKEIIAREIQSKKESATIAPVVVRKKFIK